MLGFVGAMVGGGVGAFVGLLLSFFNVLGGELPASLIVAAGGVGFVAGSLVGALVARVYYRPRLNSRDAEIKRLRVRRDAARRHEAYAKHIHLLLMRLRGNGIKSEEDSLLLEPAKIMEEATGRKFWFSIWAGGKAQPGWGIERAPDHTDRQCRSFAVPLKDSWISFMENLERSGNGGGGHSAKDFVFGLSDLEKDDARGRDLKAFRDNGFHSLRCTSINSVDCDEDEEVRCLVVLAESADAFDETEDWYIVFLGQILGLHRRMTQTGDGRGPDLPPPL